MIWYLLLIPAIIISIFLFIFGCNLCAELDIKGKMVRAHMVFFVVMVLVMGVVVLPALVVAHMSSPVLTDSVYDKIAIEMFYKD